MIGACGLRILWIYTVFEIEAMHTLQGLAISYPVSWLLTFAVNLLIFILLYKRKKRYFSQVKETVETVEEKN